jgi:antitoxin ChpS
MYTTKLRKAGGSVMLSLPPAFLDQLDMEVGNYLEKYNGRIHH